MALAVKLSDRVRESRPVGAGLPGRKASSLYEIRGRLVGETGPEKLRGEINAVAIFQLILFGLIGQRLFNFCTHRSRMLKLQSTANK